MFALIYSVGVSTGYHKLIGLYTTKEKAEEEKQRDMQNGANFEWNYSIEEIAIDNPVNIVFDEW